MCGYFLNKQGCQCIKLGDFSASPCQSISGQSYGFCSKSPTSEDAVIFCGLIYVATSFSSWSLLSSPTLGVCSL